MGSEEGSTDSLTTSPPLGRWDQRRALLPVALMVGPRVALTVGPRVALPPSSPPPMKDPRPRPESPASNPSISSRSDRRLLLLRP